MRRCTRQYPVVEKFSLLTGTTNPVVNALPWALVIAAVGGIVHALRLRARHPERWQGIAQVEIREDVEPAAPVLEPVPQPVTAA